MVKLVLSSLSKVRILDLDGTLVKRNGYLDGQDALLESVKEFFEKIGKGDFVIILTSRGEEYREITENFLKENGVRYDLTVFGLGHGERILINDMKPSALLVAYAVNKERDKPLDIDIVICDKL